MDRRWVSRVIDLFFYRAVILITALSLTPTRFRLYKRCVILAGHVIAQLNPSNSGFNPVSETDAPGDNIQQLVLGCHPAYQTWAPSMDEHGDIDWQWDDSPSIIGMGDVPRITFKGGSTVGICAIAGGLQYTQEMHAVL